MYVKESRETFGKERRQDRIGCVLLHDTFSHSLTQRVSSVVLLCVPHHTLLEMYSTQLCHSTCPKGYRYAFVLVHASRGTIGISYSLYRKDVTHIIRWPSRDEGLASPRSRVELQECVLQGVVDLENSSLITASVTVVGCREDCDDIALL
jgi:hypothetical protein